MEAELIDNMEGRSNGKYRIDRVWKIGKNLVRVTILFAPQPEYSSATASLLVPGTLELGAALAQSFPEQWHEGIPVSDPPAQATWDALAVVANSLAERAHRILEAAPEPPQQPEAPKPTVRTLQLD